MVVLPNVKTFDNVSVDKKQVLKIAEETLEVYSAWESWRDKEPTCDVGDIGSIHDLLDSCADVIQAALNLVAALGVEDFRPYMKACERRNRERGRITDGR